MGPRVNIRLRTQQLTFLEREAARADTSMSRIFGDLLERYAGATPDPRSIPPRKATTCLFIQSAHLSMLDGLAASSGLSRSDMARRLIDAARAEEETGYVMTAY